MAFKKFDRFKFDAASVEGLTEHEAVLNEIREARRETRSLDDTLAQLETLVMAQAPTAKPKLTEQQLWPLFGWIASVYESFYAIFGMTQSANRLDQVANRFAQQIRNASIWRHEFSPTVARTVRVK